LSHDPTPTQALLLFGLLAVHGTAAQADLMPKVKKADRETLEKKKMIMVAKEGRGLKLALADQGWAWTAANLSATLPPAQRTLSNLLLRLGDHLTTHGETIADFIGSKSEAAPPSPNAPKHKKSKAKLVTSKPLALPDVRQRIETAYLAITHGRKDESVRLSRLRAELADLDRNTVDAALGRILKGDKTASLMRHDDPRQLDQTDHDAAFNPAGEPFHVIWIAS
jgi:hypothetical protein